MADPDIGFSVQAFSEFYDKATRKLEPRLSQTPLGPNLPPRTRAFSSPRPA